MSGFFFFEKFLMEGKGMPGVSCHVYVNEKHLTMNSLKIKSIMKTKFVFLFSLVALFALTGCDKDLICVKGSGEKVVQEIPMESFDAIELSIGADVELTQGERQYVEIEGQQDIIDNIKLDVTNGVWKIKHKKCVLTHKDVTIRITLPELTSVKISGSGDVITTNTFTGLDDLDLKISGSGDMDVAAEANTLDLKISGSGNIDLYGFANAQSIDVSGSGDINSFEFPVSSCDIDIHGSGNCEVTVESNLDVKISGSGDVYYKGNPAIDVQMSGSGNLINAN